MQNMGGGGSIAGMLDYDDQLNIFISENDKTKKIPKKSSKNLGAVTESVERSGRLIWFPWRQTNEL